LRDLGLAEVPDAAWDLWKTPALADLRPILHQVAITNVVDHLPNATAGGWAPTEVDIRADTPRLKADISNASAKCLAPRLVVVALGRTAWSTLGRLQAGLGFRIDLRRVRHPSRSPRGWSEMFKEALPPVNPSF
jgi:uracil-DNA glycosylase